MLDLSKKEIEEKERLIRRNREKIEEMANSTKQKKIKEKTVEEFEIVKTNLAKVLQIEYLFKEDLKFLSAESNNKVELLHKCKKK